jgi:phage regulator Rha-like protein
MTTNILQVIESNGDLVIDSRLIADTLGIEHRAFMQTMKRYQDRIESRFGVITFEMSKPNRLILSTQAEKDNGIGYF